MKTNKNRAIFRQSNNIIDQSTNYPAIFENELSSISLFVCFYSVFLFNFPTFYYSICSMFNVHVSYRSVQIFSAFDFSLQNFVLFLYSYLAFDIFVSPVACGCLISLRFLFILIRDTSNNPTKYLI